MNTKLVEKSIASGDQLVFVYQKDDGSKVTRFATPVEIKQDANMEQSILCLQHLPVRGWRNFKVKSIVNVYRVITRNDL